ncbi:MAG: aminopeptidase P family protein [Methanocalculus sp. MSAO_Arc2]|uniref:M24 family metallopeptidase n=1 Tax=Methanocalculus sp. MSAO_Arc2 TaxID=2293855 RepID=UPI000FF2BA53|nr:MAG: aminopeptidase P family protein [Methanocalculus sp. MSAO_Arc2]
MDPLDDVLDKTGSRAYVAYGTSTNANVRYLTSFRTSDPIIYLKRYGEPAIMVVPAMEVMRARGESSCTVLSRADAGFFDILKEELDIIKATARVIAEMAGGDILLPPDFPIGLAEEIRPYNKISVDKGALSSIRAVKSMTEIQMIRKVQNAAEEAMKSAIAMISQSRPSGDHLVMRDGSLLTSERVRHAINISLLEDGCRGVDTIVASGEETSEVHLRGSGPLAANSPIIIDIFPQDEETGYYADMTRTLVRGEPAPLIREMYSIVSDAQKLAFSLIRDGADGSAVYQAIVTIFSDSGYGIEPDGFVHSLGHGVGLEVHEQPTLNARGGPLSAGNVITIEPGLYYSGIGGVRIEDMGVVTGSGFRLISRFPEVFCL